MMDEEKNLKQEAEDLAEEELEKETEEILADEEESSAEGAEESAAAKGADAAAEENTAEAGKEEGCEGGSSEEESVRKPDKKDLQIQELNDRYVRLFAEFDNFRKRTETEKSGMFNEGEKTVLLKVLPLIDNFERALQNVPEEEKDSPFADGIEKIYRSFMDLLKTLGVTPIEAVGNEFDANLHNAVMHVEDEEAGENIVVEEFQKGYMFRDKVLRYSMVKVAN